jgi:hypothetical protein
MVAFEGHACEIAMIGCGVDRRPPGTKANCGLKDRNMSCDEMAQTRIIIKPEADLTVRQVLEPIM